MAGLESFHRSAQCRFLHGQGVPGSGQRLVNLLFGNIRIPWHAVDVQLVAN